MGASTSFSENWTPKGPPEMLWDKNSCLPPPNPLKYLSQEKDSGRWGLDLYFQFSSVQSLSHVRLFETPRTAAHQASLSITNSQSFLKLMSTELVMPSNHLILCWPFSTCLQSFSASGSFPRRVGLLNQMAKVLELQLQHQSFQ